MPRIASSLVVLLAWSSVATAADEPLTREQASQALGKAIRFFRERVSVEGGYVWQYSADLSRREGEEKAKATTAWLQPPGTPSVGMALLKVYELTGEESALQGARETAHALVKGQLRSGGWDNRIEFDPRDRRRSAYRVEGDKAGEFNVTTLDDNKTQAAVLFLIEADRTLKFADETIHEAALFALDSLIKAQYPNGAWPQRYSEFPDAAKFPVKPASYADDWPRAFPKQKYANYYTFNDHLMDDMVDLMFTAAKVYGEDRYRDAAKRGGEFILLAQMPQPQPAWAQQYDADMHPAWARKFEPPSITGGESQGLMRTLLRIYRETGDEKYLKPIPSALDYLQRSLLADGRLARFYELKTNRPLFFVKDTYELTYRRDNLPTHYGFVIDSKLPAIEAEYQNLVKNGPPKKRDPKPPTIRMTNSLASRAKQAVEQLDDRGAWVEPGRLKTWADDSSRGVITTRTFIKNTELLAQFIAASVEK